MENITGVDLIPIIEKIVRAELEGEGTGHDWQHIDRVRKNALALQEREGGNREIVELAALLHDIADHKFHNGDLNVGPARAQAIIIKQGGSRELSGKVAQIISEVSYKGAGVETPVSCIESAIVQDADRLDALGAVGIARTFAYGGSVGAPIHDPKQSPEFHEEFSSYAGDKSTTINHFYEKLLLLKDRMQTSTGKMWATKRHRFMEAYLKTFFLEWEGKDLL